MAANVVRPEATTAATQRSTLASNSRSARTWFTWHPGIAEALLQWAVHGVRCCSGGRVARSRRRRRGFGGRLPFFERHPFAGRLGRTREFQVGLSEVAGSDRSLEVDPQNGPFGSTD